MIKDFSTQRLALTPEISTRYIDTGGSGEPVILIHGLAASIETWRDNISELAKTHRVLAFDLPGFGKADKPKNADYKALTFFVPMLRAFMDALKLESAHMVGSSMGASLIIRFAARYPERVDKIVLANPGGFGRYIHPFLRVPTLPILGTIMSKPMRITNAFALKLTLANREKRTNALLDEVDSFSKMPGAHHAFVKTLKGLTSIAGLKDLEEFKSDAGAVKSQTLIIWGDKDKLFPVTQSETARGYMPDAEIRIIKGAGHFPQIDTPQDFNAITSEFLCKVIETSRT